MYYIFKLNGTNEYTVCCRRGMCGGCEGVNGVGVHVKHAGNRHILKTTHPLCLHPSPTQCLILCILNTIIMMCDVEMHTLIGSGIQVTQLSLS